MPGAGSGLPRAAQRRPRRHCPVASAQSGCRVITQNVDDLHLQAGTREFVQRRGSIRSCSRWKRCAAGEKPGGMIA
jgi:hypothetical protein